jgi:multisubunit Na+/H+ antiporter MnhB subunit
MISRLAAIIALFAVAPGIIIRSAAHDPLLTAQVTANLGASGVESPVTAVLLNFRSLDTLLEVSILAAAVLGVLALPPARPPARAIPPMSMLTEQLIPRLAPLIGLVVIYLWWAGSSRPGGAFQAGAALTGLLLLFHFAERSARKWSAPGAALGLALAGPLLFLAIGLLPLAWGAMFLDYPVGGAKAAILTIEAGLTVSIGGALALLALGGSTDR